MQAGRDRSWSKPYNPHEDSDSPEGSGTHVGPWACLNVRNRQPGFRYAFGHRADAGGITTMRQMGFDFVREGDPEMLGADLPTGLGGSSDGLTGMGRLVLMKIPLERYRQRQLETARAQAASREGPTQQFLSRNAEFTRAQGGRSPKSGAAFAYPEHGATGYRDSNNFDPDAEE